MELHINQLQATLNTIMFGIEASKLLNIFFTFLYTSCKKVKIKKKLKNMKNSKLSYNKKETLNYKVKIK